MPGEEAMGVTTYIRINEGGVTDWPTVSQILALDPEYIAMVPDAETGRHVPESRRLIVPWQEKDRIFICKRAAAQRMLDECKLRLDAIREAIGADGR
jgi:hypothetical protein